MSAKAVLSKNKCPDFGGVPGTLIDLPDNLGLVFGKNGKTSPYDGLLEQLASSRDRKVLQFGNVRAKASVYARAKKLGIKVLFAQQGDVLYVKFGGWAPDSERWKSEARTGIKDTIATQPRSEIQIAVALRAKGMNDIDAAMVGAILKQMEQAQEVVRQRDGSWSGPSK